MKTTVDPKLKSDAPKGIAVSDKRSANVKPHSFAIGRLMGPSKRAKTRADIMDERK